METGGSATPLGRHLGAIIRNSRAKNIYLTCSDVDERVLLDLLSHEAQYSLILFDP